MVSAYARVGSLEISAKMNVQRANMDLTARTSVRVETATVTMYRGTLLVIGDIKEKGTI